ncbi:MAG: Flp pilus assembly complex ATPase component TadA [Nanoarchaeota archaeon]|nr:Flp pilus assembly complex ATPase component TadA [Nanoarchaeota archaeon]
MKDIKKPEKQNSKLKRVVPDTSAIINGSLTKLVISNKLNNSEIIIPELVMGELQAQTSRMRESGFTGLEEIKKIRKLIKKHKIVLKFVGERPSYEDIMLSKSGRLDALIQDEAKKYKAVLVTSDLPQALVAEAEGIKVEYSESYKKKTKLRIENYLTKDTISLHLKDGVVPTAKRGKPGNTHLVKINNKKIKEEELELMANEIFEAARFEENIFIEKGGRAASIIQLKDMRIIIAKPPFSEKMEITLTRPIVKLTLNDYKLSAKVKKMLDAGLEGLLLIGLPGAGKTTFAVSIAEFLIDKKEAVVKTMETSHDLQVRSEITQYGQLSGSFSKTADILLQVRPDYVIFDDIRKEKDFEIFSDIRLAGIGMVGVMHSANLICAVQRFVKNVELGTIPHIIDTIIYIKDGKISNVYSLNMVVRTPQGMNGEPVRPIIEIRDFENSNLEYEIYNYGEQTVVVPVKRK